MEMQRVIKILAKADADRLRMKDKMEANRKKDREDFLAKLDSYQEKAEIGLGELLARLEDVRQTDRRELKKMMDVNQARTDGKLQELTERTGKTQQKLKSVEVCLCARTDKLQEEVTKTKREFQARLKKVQTRTKRGITVSASTAQPPTFYKNST
ncbi:coiled-coil domain-containing protein 152-like [Cryptotermes secundus]|uniref:coiled-coil domain-containing protein 152-like n=1 Tax=Cryptotermes secundus TaxID=105785 RepID=UPI000CD7C1B2|nr:coiled-coil domain-containing protein 152-like [Cryptotermes secundus]